MLKELDLLVPGTAERLINLAESESLHRRSLELMALEANIKSQTSQNIFNQNQLKTVYRSDTLGQIIGGLVCLACVLASFNLGLNGKEWLAAAIAAIPTGALIKAFVINKKML